MNVLGILGVEDSAKIVGINQNERPASTRSEQEDGIKFANLGEIDLEPQKFRSSGEGHRMKRIKSKA